MKRHFVARGGVITWLAICLVSAQAAADEDAGFGTLSGRVTAPDGSPAVDARVSLVELGRASFVDQTGAYRFESVPVGSYHVQAVSSAFGSGVWEIEISAGENRLDLRLVLSPHREAIVVTATRSARGSAELIQPVTVIEKERLSRLAQASLGATLDEQPGLRSTQFGAGSSRPVIRGQGGGRVRILENGLDVGDASSTSPDHAVSANPFLAERIEILRGPSTLLYGSSAVGGVVNVIDHRIPEFLPQRSIEGVTNLRFGGADGERSFALTLDGTEKALVWHLDAFTREASDYDIPAPAVRGDPDSPSGVLPNSGVEAAGAGLGVSWIGRHGFVGLSAGFYETIYGIPAEIELEEPENAHGTGSGVSIDLDQQRYELRGNFELRRGPFDATHFALSATNYVHREIAGDEIGTRFFNDNVDARFELSHGQSRRLSGVIGLQYTDRDLEAIGEEAFLPPSVTESLSFFALEELSTGSWRFELGARMESVEISADGGELAARDFDAASASAGVVWLPGESLAIGLSVARSERAPSAEELYADGPHVATFSYERGDVDLTEESSLGVDLSLRKRAGRLTGELSLFRYRYDDFIFEAPTDEILDGLPVFEFAQADAEFRGYELSGAVSLYHDEEHDLDLTFGSEDVRGELTGSGEPLPRMPARRYRGGVRYESGSWHASAEIVRTHEQDRAAPLETPTPGHELIGASVGYRFAAGGQAHQITLVGRNLTDAEARLHTSRLKDLVPLPGRGITLVYRLIF
ncbi:MAG: TonB-dependent receptor [Acidobacteriota bacterium]|nr:MAG: TonB-dependent receptor [Acidobacteriota bacterium]